MAEINEAYRVLRNPAARASYDTTLRTAERAHVPVRERTSFTVPASVPSVSGPARFPWRLSAVMAGAGAAVVIVGAALYEPPGEPRPDNVLDEGSCVAIEINADAREVNCTGEPGDLVVQALVATGEVCPNGMAAHRDRQGMGVACVVERGS